jgi:DMSO/TMAO reductase YedYZ molybdopterin-dependent catalytic subunit
VLAAPAGSPILVVGALVIDLVPGWVKDAVVDAFGTGDKTFLLVVLGVLTAVLAAFAGVLESRRPPLGRLLIAAGGVFGAVAAATRADAGVFSVIPSIVAAVIAMLILSALIRRLPRPVAGAAASPPLTAAERRARAQETAGTSPAGSRPYPAPDSRRPVPDRRPLSRRGFLLWSGALTAAGVLATLGGRALTAGTNAVVAIRQALKLPRAAVTAPPIPAGAELHIRGLADLVTPNADFYRIDTALQVPQINPHTWSLELGGMVEKPITLTWDELIRLPLEESYTTLACVSNIVGGELISNAKWLGYPIRHLLARARPLAGADCVLSTSQDGWTATTPLQALTDGRNAILAVGMNDQPLPFDHGFPVRMVVPGLYGYVSATKWVVRLEVTRFSDARSYWSERGWSVLGPIKLESRIDVPFNGQSVAAGDVVVAGVAWDQHVGISGVEVQVDDGPWSPATLAAQLDIDTWRQWHWEWKNASRGNHKLTVRATNANGEVQTSVVAQPAPNGASGYDQIDVSVR